MNGVIQKNLEFILSRMESVLTRTGRKKEEILILGVSKKQSAEKVREAWRAGVKAFGENYIQESLPKIKELSDLPIQWHFIGGLQRNKSKMLVEAFDLFHALDSFSLAQSISKKAIEIGKVQKCLIQVNLESEITKGGIAAESGPEFLDKLQTLEGLCINGLMCMPPVYPNSKDRHRLFSQMKSLQNLWSPYLSKGSRHNLMELSMGTSHDFEEAIDEGATIIRLGTLLMGERG